MTGQVTEFNAQTPASGRFGITGGPGGNIWFTEETANRIGRRTPPKAPK